MDRTLRIYLVALVVERQIPTARPKAHLRVEHEHIYRRRFYIPMRVRNYAIKTPARMQRALAMAAAMNKKYSPQLELFNA